MAVKLPPVDVVIVGSGWTGGIVAKELAPTGLKVVMLERGRFQDTSPDFAAPQSHDALKYSRRLELAQDLSKETVTFRNDASQTALPMRQYGFFIPGTNVGGSGAHWSGLTWRWSEWEHRMLSGTVEKYGRSIIPSDMHLQDWPIAYKDIEPYYDRFEKVCGISGKAGNLRGKIQPGGNPFEAPRRNEYPLPPMTAAQSMVMFEAATKNLGYNPFPIPTANCSGDYVNPDGVALGQCHYCGHCTNYGCEANAKASPHFTMIPLARKNRNFELRTNSMVMKVNLDSEGKRATGVTYVDARGREYEQPADLVVLGAFVTGNVQLMLHSGIGKPYDAQSNTGVVGRNYAFQSLGGARVEVPRDTFINPFMGSGALGTWIDDWNGDNFDFGKAGYIAGGGISAGQNSGDPLNYHPTGPGQPRWGAGWKKAMADGYQHSTGVGFQGAVMSYRQNFLDLDPTYRDAWGRPLLRVTFDWQANEQKIIAANTAICQQIAAEMSGKKASATPAPGRLIPGRRFSSVPYQTSHNTGGAVFGDDPRTSAVNKYCQSWDVPNVFVLGASALPQNAGRNPTGPVGALAFWAADAIANRYLKRPGRLV
ncbi:GMC family oxidoreductase [Sphingomonas sp. S1-29]|uniref:GMC family oxidoreductase n=1 Tax=Sphingomonas sp. S1-29 TaxID=2991074 RepID=UPI0022401989|nr:GMC family oxidoreductase [Sphingomonas sp. S1-29]UZK69662.1 GMC family oxidoreductase [Sphingomonas sp. S1-29]